MDREFLSELRGFLKEKFSFEPVQQPETVERLLASFERVIETKLDQNGGQVHHYFGRYVGLIFEAGNQSVPLRTDRCAPQDARARPRSGKARVWEIPSWNLMSITAL